MYSIDNSLRVFRVYTEVKDTRETWVDKYESSDGMRMEYEYSTTGSLTREHVVEEIDMAEVIKTYEPLIEERERLYYKMEREFPFFEIKWVEQAMLEELNPTTKSAARYDYEDGDKIIGDTIYVVGDKFSDRIVLHGISRGRLIITGKYPYEPYREGDLVRLPYSDDEKLACRLVESKLCEEGENVITACLG